MTLKLVTLFNYMIKCKMKYKISMLGKKGVIKTKEKGRLR